MGHQESLYNSTFEAVVGLDGANANAVWLHDGLELLSRVPPFHALSVQPQNNKTDVTSPAAKGFKHNRRTVGFSQDQSGGWRRFDGTNVADEAKKRKQPLTGESETKSTGESTGLHRNGGQDLGASRCQSLSCEEWLQSKLFKQPYSAFNFFFYTLSAGFSSLICKRAEKRVGLYADDCRWRVGSLVYFLWLKNQSTVLFRTPQPRSTQILQFSSLIVETPRICGSSGSSLTSSTQEIPQMV